MDMENGMAIYSDWVSQLSLAHLGGNSIFLVLRVTFRYVILSCHFTLCDVSEDILTLLCSLLTLNLAVNCLLFKEFIRTVRNDWLN